MKKFFLIATAVLVTSGLGLIITKTIAKPTNQTPENAVQKPTIQYTRTIQEFDKTGFTVNLTIEKGAISGTAKVQETIPDGFAVEFNEVASALTSLNGNTIKFLWENIPNQNIIQLAYTVYKTGKIDKELTIGGYFLFLENDIANKKISDPTSFKFEDGKIEMIELDDRKKEKYLEKQKENIDPSDLPQKEEPEVLVTRDFSAPTEKPEAPSKNNNTANESLKSNSASEEKLTFGESDENNLNEDFGSEELNLDNEKTIFNESANNSSNNNLNYNTKEANNSNTDISLTDETAVKDVNNLSEAFNENSNPSEATLTGGNIASNPQGLIYKVQVCALQETPVKPGYFNKKHSITDEIIQESHEGWTKYTTGVFTLYKQGRDYREILRDNHNVIGPFVTAYNKGNRITVQEALMISNQKWYK